MLLRWKVKIMLELLVKRRGSLDVGDTVREGDLCNVAAVDFVGMRYNLDSPLRLCPKNIESPDVYSSPCCFRQELNEGAHDVSSPVDPANATSRTHF